MLGFDVVDPRLHHPPRTIDTKRRTTHEIDMLQLLTAWPVDKSQPPQHIFSRRARVLASRALPSQKSINRRKGQAAPGVYPEQVKTDPRIPIIAFVSKSTSRGQGMWTIMMPWKCVTPIWYSLMFYPLSTGGTLRFGGLDQTRQVAYEAGIPWFPGDCPGTESGRTWEETERKKREAAWESRPKGRRIEYENVDLGHGRKGEIGTGWACDWDHLFEPESAGQDAVQMPLAQATKLLRTQEDQTNSVGPSLTSVKITMMQQGVVHTCARIYRLPTTDEDLRSRWLERSQQTTKRAQKSQGKQATHRAPDTPHKRREYLAAMLLGDLKATNDDRQSPPVAPDRADLIGFVTTGNFNLSEGVGTCVGSIALGKAIKHSEMSSILSEEVRRLQHLCIVRESGQGSCRLARWELA